MSVNFDEIWALGVAGQATPKTISYLYKLLEAPNPSTELQVCVSRIELAQLDAYSAINRAAEALAGLNNSSPWSGRALTVMSQGYGELGHTREGHQFAREAKQVSSEADEAEVFLAMAHNELVDGNLDVAERATATAIQVFNAHGKTQEMVAATIQLGTIRKEMGQPSAAERAFEIAGRHLTAGQELQRARIDALRASTVEEPGLAELRLIMHSVALAEQHDQKRALLEHYGDFAHVLSATGDHEKAALVAQKLTTLAEKSGMIRPQLTGHKAMSNVLLRAGQVHQAQMALARARDVKPSMILNDTTRVQHTLIQLKKLHRELKQKIG
ncbi:MAG: hypothetical protein JNJ45_03505 [Chthonomonas sp.]|nr:hypothetical protein [Chthonomonas sp.]